MVEISEKATIKIKELLSSNEIGNLFLRLGVSDGGCSGLSYNLAFDTDEQVSDIVIEREGFRIVIDQESLNYVQGVKIDFKEMGMSDGFTIDNPNAKASCSCGASFRTANYRGTPKKC
jgi:iron-sulfur cluster assembly protein